MFLGGANDSPSGFAGINNPVENVDWYDAVEFCNALSAKSNLPPYYTINGTNVTIASGNGTGYRLPTDAEWVHAAKGGESHTYSGSDTVGDVAWYKDNSGNKTHTVGTKTANGYGLHDMSGNVYEWIYDWHPSHVDTYRVVRGGQLRLLCRLLCCSFS